ncbi:hypothetical protein PR048_023559 [Dryococelus australis]|uniref:GAG-pre-integrase domain-containing protein n=1 Tax=Dryococelus australis TaxID=614101 RepID=A0ABQ9GUG6_9NEOP|nr:hypothetical protein PR048_023559 [Dryococelus australis]
MESDQCVIILKGKSNRDTWRSQTKIILAAKGCLEVVERYLKPKDESSPSLKEWMQKDIKACEIIATRMDEITIKHISTCSTAHKLLFKLVSINEQKSIVSLHLQQQQFFNTRYSISLTATRRTSVGRLLMEEERIDETTESLETAALHMSTSGGKLPEAIGIGDINVAVFDGHEWKETAIKDVLCVPKAKLNLLSVVIGKTDTCSIQKNRVVCVAQIEYLFVVKARVFIKTVTTNSANTLDTWHQKLAHQNTSHMKYVLNKFGVKYSNKSDSDNFCQHCFKGKPYKLPFKMCDSRTTKSGELVHVDLNG